LNTQLAILVDLARRISHLTYDETCREKFMKVPFYLKKDTLFFGDNIYASLI